MCIENGRSLDRVEKKKTQRVEKKAEILKKDSGLSLNPSKELR